MPKPVGDYDIEIEVRCYGSDPSFLHVNLGSHISHPGRFWQIRPQRLQRRERELLSPTPLKCTTSATVMRVSPGAALRGLRPRLREFRVPVPADIPEELVAPILCGSVTTLSLLRYESVRIGSRAVIVGIGGFNYFGMFFSL